MFRVFLALLFLLSIAPALADMYQDGSNAKLAGSGAPAATVCQDAGGKLLSSSTNCGLSGNWVNTVLTGVYAYLNNIARFPVAAINGGASHGSSAVLGAARTSDITTPDTCCTIGLSSFAYNDNAAIPMVAWGTYNTSVRAPGAGGILGSEWDIGNQGSLVPLTPYAIPPGLTVPLWVACGGELHSTALSGTLNPCSAAMSLVWNGAPFDKGIVFQQAALSSHGTEAWAINLPVHGMVRWENTDGGTVGFVDSQIDTTADAMGLMFTNFGALFETPAGGIQTQVAFVANAVNYPQLSGGVTGSGAILNATGSDANVDLILQAKATTPPGGNVVLHNPLRLQKVLFANLPPCNGTFEGDMLAIPDSNTAVFNAAITAGGGTNHVIAYCSGTQWTVH
jgi:hypothetical protein